MTPGAECKHGFVILRIQTRHLLLRILLGHYYHPHQERKDRKDHQEIQERQDRQDHKETQDRQDRQERQDREYPLAEQPAQY
jgi:hypothetical protein